MLTINNQADKILWIVAADSGGHIIPAVVRAREWLKQNPHGKVIALTSMRQRDAKIYRECAPEIHLEQMIVDPFPGKRFWWYPHFFYIFARALWHIKNLIKRDLPSEIIATGGIMCVPVAIIARRYNIPMTVYELNTIPGKATRFVASMIQKVITVFPTTCAQFSPKTICYREDYPLRFATDDLVYDKQQVLVSLNQIRSRSRDMRPFTTTRTTILVLGGSQGSAQLNACAKHVIALLTPQYSNYMQVIHQYGRDMHDWNEWYAGRNVPAWAFDFFSDMRRCMQAADIIISRAGAGALFEIAFFKKPALILPLVGRADDHQMRNFQEICKMYPGLFTLVQQEADMTGALRPLVVKKEEEHRQRYMESS